MRPLRLRLKNFRSFREEQVIDFADLGLFALIGETGAGKSSILQAISYALYSRPTFDDGAKHLIYSAEQTLVVEMDFESRGERYRVVRTTSRNAYPLFHHKLEFLDSDAAAIAGQAEVNARIIQILGGLTHESFTRSVLLPQNEFDLLLLERRGERMRILKQVLGLSRIDRMRERLLTPRDEVRTAMLEQNAILSLIPEDLDESVESHERRAVVAAERVEFLSVGRARIATNEKAIAELEARSVAAANTMATLESAGALREKHAGLRKVAVEISSAIAKSEERLESLRIARADLAAKERAAESEGRDGAALAGVAERLASLRRERDAIAAEDGEVASERLAFTAAQSSVEEQQKKLVALQATLSAARDAEKMEAERSTEEEETVTQAGSAVTAHRDARSALASAATVLAGEKQRLKDARHAVIAAEKAASIAAKDETSAADEHRQAERLAGIAAYVGHLRAGHTCPVCSSVLAEGFVAPVAPNVKQSLQQLSSVRSLAGRASATHARTLANVEALERGSLAAKTTLDAAAGACSAAEDRLRKLGVAVPEDGSHEALLNGLRARIRSARDRIKPFRVAVEVALKAYESAREGLERDRRAATQQSERLQRRATALGRRRDEAEQGRLLLAEGFRPSARFMNRELSAIDKKLTDGRAQAVARSSAITEVEKALQVENDARLATERMRGERVERPLMELRRQMRELAASLTLVAVDGIAPPPTPAIDVALDAEAAYATALVDVANVALERLRGAAERRVRETLEARSIIDGILEASNVADIESLQKEIEDVRVSRESLRSAVARLHEDLDRRQSASEALTKMRPVAAAIETLYNLLLDSRFPTFVVNRRQQQLLATASVILRRMTKDRYGFYEDFDIIDIPLGQRRSARTLSGGETFLASLALALALSEITAADGAAVGSLFLDEGFGTLDDDALDAAMTELQRRSATGRLIGVISHVRTVAEHVDNVLRVKANILGSTVTVLDSDELAEFTEDGVAESLRMPSAV